MSLKEPFWFPSFWPKDQIYKTVVREVSVWTSLSMVQLTLIIGLG